jgi:hypothetical protein
LFSEYDWWSAFLDEIEEHRPEVALVGLGESFACCGEWLAWAGASPDGLIFRPSGKL